ncbi:MAG: DHH family phosphoesterase [Lachnospiraceae bacterium]|nr:DHH family phosphoesterase [Lachnospiraceae bacterium]
MKNNKSKIRIKGALRTYLNVSVYLGIFLAVINLLVYLVDYRAGLIVSCYVLGYFAITMYLYLRNKSVVLNELVSFATEYGQIQRQLLREFELPYALLDDGGRIIWTNKMFEQTLHTEKGYSKPISTIFPDVNVHKLLAQEDEASVAISLETGEYTAKIKKISLKEMAENSDIISPEGYDGYLIAFYLFDETALRIALQENDNQSLAVGMIYLDNYEEALESIEEVRRSLLIALIDRKVNKYIAAVDGICKKLEKDKYLVILRKQAVTQLQSTRFELMDDVKTVNIGNEMAVTVSIGIGLGGLTYSQNYEFARTSVDLALGRGGDQAVVKTPDKISYYGGKSQQVEKSTRVKARVKAHALQEIITAKDSVIIMGHRLADVDSFGAAVGLYRIAKSLDRKAHIVLDQATTSVKPLVDLFVNNEDYEADMIVNSTQALELPTSNAVLVVVDVNKPSITECPELLKLCKSIVVLDHHRQGSETIENATLSYVEAYASSTCEMVSEILQYINDGVKVRSDEADCMYSGIMIDTNNFMSKTGVRTFEAAAYLRRCGADVTRVRKLFRDDAVEYKTKADAVSQAEIYKTDYAISVCKSEDLESPTIVGAQAANELLNIKGIKASFILTEYQGKIYVSARSIDEVNVQVIMERLGGGGHMTIAGCQFEGITVSEGIAKIKGCLDEMLEEGEL